MNGMMWFDDDKSLRLEDRVQRAVSYYENKYSVRPTAVHVPEDVLSEEGSIGGIKVVPMKNIPKHHIFVGVE